MRLRPATPLAVLLFIAFVLLVLATVSTPIVKAVPLAGVNGVTLGVFGYCAPDPKGCTSIQFGYSVDAVTLFGDAKANSDFSLPTGARSSLSSILIVHPVAALLTLTLFIMAVAAHVHAPSHSPKFLMAIIIFSMPTLLVTLLAFLVDLLLFVPHMAWGGWIVLASTIIILASSILTWAMRRTLVSRKERKKRIAENAEMNGQNFYAHQNPVPQGLRADSPPPLSSTAVAHSEKLTNFATYEKSSDDDRIPLNSRQPSNKTLPGSQRDRSLGPPGGRGNGYGAPIRGAPQTLRGGRGGFAGPKDEYGNTLPPSNAFGPAPPIGIRRDMSEPPMRRQYSDESMNLYGARGGRDRGGYPPRGYSRRRPYGSSAGRGGFGTGPPSSGYGGEYPPYGRPAQKGGPGLAGYARSPSAPGYGRRNYSPAPPAEFGGYGRGSPGPLSAPGTHDGGPSCGVPSDPGGYNRGTPRGPPSDPGGYNHDRQDVYNEPTNLPYRNPSPPMPPLARQPEDYAMIGQAVEMDARHGSPSAISQRMHDSGSTVRGLVGLQQQQAHRESPMSMTSVYSGYEPYVPPRAAWKDNNPTDGPPPAVNFLTTDSATKSSTMDPIELPEQNTIRKPRADTGPSGLNGAAHGRKQSSDNYYEDVDPRFASPSQPHIHVTTQQSMPSALMAGPQHAPVEQHAELVDPESSYEDLADGQRSPASDHSNLTSISQRGVNPNWHPANPQHHRDRLGVPGGRKPVPQSAAVVEKAIPPGSYGSFPHQGPVRGPPPGNSFASTVAPPVTSHGQAF